MIKEKFSGLKEILFSKRSKHIMATAAVTLVVFLFFIWLGMGMYVSVPAENRGELWPVFGMYGVFPAIIFFFGVKKVHGILNGEDDDEESEDNEE
ncbi:MAG: hypothetical protein IJO22_03275 [Oscillospiraceae bacterium]|nr:hypothetical protein [Oscillospiraceae bacterium]